MKRTVSASTEGNAQTEMPFDPVAADILKIVYGITPEHAKKHFPGLVKAIEEELSHGC